MRVNTEKEKPYYKRALEFASLAHQGQVRKYTGEPYITHPIAVAEILLSSSATWTEPMVSAALLHDVVEDTKVTLDLIEYTFGIAVASLVNGLTQFSQKSDGNRAVRKALDARFLSRQCPDVQTIKYADLIHNTESIVKFDPKFGKTYLAEKRVLLKVMDQGNSGLRQQALKACNAA